MHAIESYTVDKNSYAMRTIKITPNLLFEHQCTSGKFIRLPNRIETFFLPELECSCSVCPRWVWHYDVTYRKLMWIGRMCCRSNNTALLAVSDVTDVRVCVNT